MKFKPSSVVGAIVLTTTLLFVCCYCFQVVNGQAMGFESESASFSFQGGVPNSRQAASVSQVTFTKNAQSAVLKKGSFLDVAPPYPKSDWNSPKVHPTFEIIDANLFPVEFVSDPIPFNRNDKACELNAKLKTSFDQLYHGVPDLMLDKYFTDRGLSMTGNAGLIDQALQITYSFPVDKAMMSLRAIVSFLNQRGFTSDASMADRVKQHLPQMEPKWAKSIDVSLMNQILTFLDMDATTKALPDNVKFFLFFMFQYFANGSVNNNCALNSYAKLISGLVLLRTNMHEFALYGGERSVRSLLSQRIPLIKTAYQAFVDRYNGNSENKMKLSLCKDAQGTAYFAKHYYINKPFPFTADQYFADLFNPNKGSDLFAKNRKVFDDAFGRFGLLVNRKPTVVFELRSLDGFKYSSNFQLSLQDHARKIPTYFHLLGQIMTKDKYDQIDYGVKMCNAQGRIVPFSTENIAVVTKQDVTNPPPQPQPAPQQQQQVSNLRENTRGLRQEVRDQRRTRRNAISLPSGSSPLVPPSSSPPPPRKLTRANSVPNVKPKSVGGVTTLNNNGSGEENLSELRAEKRMMRVRKRINRERRRKFEQDQSAANGGDNKNSAADGSVQREKLRIAREQKRLAREEARDLAEGVQPVSNAEVKQIINKQKEKKARPQPAKSQGVRGNLVHKITHNQNGDVVIRLNVNFSQ